jgi:hypothetical protein
MSSEHCSTRCTCSRGSGPACNYTLAQYYTSPVSRRDGTLRSSSGSQSARTFKGVSGETAVDYTQIGVIEKEYANLHRYFVVQWLGKLLIVVPVADTTPQKHRGFAHELDA